MRKKFVGTDPANHNSENVWFTPPEIIKALGPFDLDVCTMTFRPFNTARKHIEHDKGQDAFKINWKGFIWMNPPYGKEIEPFIKKFDEHHNGIALVFSRTGTPWFQNWIKEGGQVFFLRKRVAFINKQGVKGANAGTDSCLLFCGAEAYDRIKKSGIDGVFL